MPFCEQEAYFAKGELRQGPAADRKNEPGTCATICWARCAGSLEGLSPKQSARRSEVTSVAVHLAVVLRQLLRDGPVSSSLPLLESDQAQSRRPGDKNGPRCRLVTSFDACKVMFSCFHDEVKGLASLRGDEKYLLEGSQDW